MATFDECFATLPALSEKPRDLDSYWKKQITKLKKVPLDVEAKRKVSKRILTETQMFLSFQSIGRVQLTAQLMAPKKFRKKPPVVIIFPDYHEKDPPIINALTQAGIAQVVLNLRGHDRLNQPVINENGEEEEIKSLGYFSENLVDKDEFYLRNLFLDAFRTLEVTRLRREIDASRIGVWGRGVGAAMALFVTKYMQRTGSLLLEHPSFAHLALTQNLSKSRYAQEINQFIKTHRKQSTKVKENLRYFDGLYFSPAVKAPTAMIMNLKNSLAVPQGGFAMFHHIPAEKEMHLFTSDDEKTLREQAKKTVTTSSEFFKKSLIKS